jgi:outer membrane protein, multidrug efflux system
MNRQRLCALSLASTIMLALGACSLTPTYEKPEIAVPEQFKESTKIWTTAQPADQADKGQWWLSFKDEQLNQLLATGVQDNFQLAAAAARYSQARSYLDASDAALYPQIGLMGMTTDNRQSDNRPLRSSTQPSYYDDNRINAVASYEIDVWGRVRASVDSANALAQASLADLAAVRLLIQTDIANTYFSILGQDAQIGVIKRSIQAYEKQATIIEHRFTQGVSSGADYYRVQTLVENERVRLSAYQTKRAQLEHTLALLIGKLPSEFSLPPGDIFNINMPQAPAAIPSVMLQRRPDIASSERKVMAANSEIGVAKAAFFPSLTLSAVAGWQNATNRSVINAPDRFWSVGPMVFFTLFDGGRRDALVKQANAKHTEAQANYKTTVLTAFKEVEDLLVDINNREAAQKSIDQAYMLSSKTYGVSTSRYKEGIASYLEIVDAALQRSQIELQRADQRTQLLIARTTLVKALGGDWQ